MKIILKALMVVHDHSGHRLEELSGVPAATTYRFLNGDHDDPKTDTVRLWAKAYHVTEAQLRGLVPLDPIMNAAFATIPPVELVMPRLTAEEKETLTVMKRIKKDSLRSWLRIGHELADRRRPGQLRPVPNDRRNSPIPHGKRRTVVGNNVHRVRLALASGAD